MTLADVWPLLPYLIPTLAGTAVMLLGAAGSRVSLRGVTLVGGLLSLVTVLLTTPVGSVAGAAGGLTEILRFDAYSRLLMVLLYGSVVVVTALSGDYLRRRDSESEAFYSLILFAAVGMAALASSTHFAGLFLGLEILSVSLYALIGHLTTVRASLEAAAKYLVLASISSAFLLFGIALTYAATGTLEMRPAIAGLLSSGTLAGGASPGVAVGSLWALAAAGLLVVGFAFKLAVVPFHMWSPDVYEGAPTPVAMLLATGSKAAVVAAMLRALALAGIEGVLGGGAADSAAALLQGALTLLAVATMLGGNLLALLQPDLRRLLGYSAVGHLGYVLVGVIVGGEVGAAAATFYMLGYVPTTLIALGLVTVLGADPRNQLTDVSDLCGLAQRRPLAAAVLGVAMLSLAGIPPTVGFFAKFAVLAAAIRAGSALLAISMVLASAIGLYIYLRMVVAAYLREPEHRELDRSAPLPGLALLALLALLVLVLGLYPQPVLSAVEVAVATAF